MLTEEINIWIIIGWCVGGVVLLIAVGVLLWMVRIIHSVDGVVLLVALGVLLWKVSIMHSVGGVVLLIALFN